MRTSSASAGGHTRQLAKLSGLLSLVLIGLCAGCGGGSSYDVAPVSGRITLDGQPLANARVTFQPTQDQASMAPGSVGTTDADGRYVLSMSTEEGVSGAVPGQHTVRISTMSDPADDAAPAADRSLPPAASDGSLTFEVPTSGTDQADFEL